MIWFCICFNIRPGPRLMPIFKDWLKFSTIYTMFFKSNGTGDECT